MLSLYIVAAVYVYLFIVTGNLLYFDVMFVYNNVVVSRISVEPGQNLCTANIYIF